MGVVDEGPEYVVAVDQSLEFVEVGELFMLAIHYKIYVEIRGIPHEMLGGDDFLDAGAKLAEMVEAVDAVDVPLRARTTFSSARHG